MEHISRKGTGLSVSRSKSCFFAWGSGRPSPGPLFKEPEVLLETVRQ